MMLLICGACFFLLAATQLKGSALPSNGKFARARSAWYETCQEHKCLLMASCVLLSLYSNIPLRACTVVADHLRFHFVGRRMTVEACLVAFMHLCFFQSAARFRDRHVIQNPLRMTHLLRRAELKQVEGVLVVASSVRSGLSTGTEWSLEYTANDSIDCPQQVVIVLNFVCKVWCNIACIQQLWFPLVMLNWGDDLAGLVTGFGLEFLAGLLSGPDADSATLQLVGVLCGSTLLPGLAGACVPKCQKQNK
eukprot:5717655-Amphidinium_carterae.1